MDRKCALILIPGAGMSDWIWEATRQFLDSPIISITNRLDINTYQTRKSSTLNDCVEHILNVIKDTEYEKFIVVGHSGAGVVAAKLCQAIPERIQHAIYVAANIPKHGTTMIDSLPFLIRIINVLAIRRMVRNDSIPYSKIEKVMRERFCNDSGQEVIQTVLSERMLSEPMCAVTEKMNWSDFPQMKQTYLLLLKDKTLSLDRQRYMASNLAINEFDEIDSDHMVMLSHPQEFAKAINSISKRYI
jgi:pimeloyl-ACP methyl ester carboxylesterase